MFVLFISFKDSLIFLSDDSKLIFLAKISNEIFSSLLPKGNLTFIIILFFIFSIVSFLLSLSLSFKIIKINKLINYY